MRDRAAIVTGGVAAVVALAGLLATLLFPGAVPVGVVALGAMLGTGTGLMAVGLVLTYRTSRIINFGYGAIGTVGAGVAAGAATGQDLPWPVALALGTATGVACGVLSAVESTF